MQTMILLDKLSHRTGYVKKEKDLHQVIKQNKAQGFTGDRIESAV